MLVTQGLLPQMQTMATLISMRTPQVNGQGRLGPLIAVAWWTHNRKLEIMPVMMMSSTSKKKVD
jgi:hypothetical protein